MIKLFSNKKTSEEKYFNSKTLEISERHLGDYIFQNITRLFAFFVLAIILLIFLEMFIESLPSINKFGLGFITSSHWNPVKDQYGALPFIFGTLDRKSVV